jgi:hypothetical protein
MCANALQKIHYRIETRKQKVFRAERSGGPNDVCEKGYNLGCQALAVGVYAAASLQPAPRLQPQCAGAAAIHTRATVHVTTPESARSLPPD